MKLPPAFQTLRQLVAAKPDDVPKPPAEGEARARSSSGPPSPRQTLPNPDPILALGSFEVINRRETGPIPLLGRDPPPPEKNLGAEFAPPEPGSEDAAIARSRPQRRVTHPSIATDVAPPAPQFRDAKPLGAEAIPNVLLSAEGCLDKPLGAEAIPHRPLGAEGALDKPLGAEFPPKVGRLKRLFQALRRQTL